MSYLWNWVLITVDEHGQSVRIPEWIPETEIDKKENETAKKLMEIRKK